MKKTEGKLIKRERIWWMECITIKQNLKKRVKKKLLKPKTWAYTCRISAAQWQLERGWTCWTSSCHTWRHTAVSARVARNCFPSVHWTKLIASCVRWVCHTQSEERLLYVHLGRVISQVSVRHSCLYFTSILVSTFGLHLLLRVLFSLRKQTNVSFHMIFLQDFKDVFFFPPVSFRTRRFALSTRSQKVNTVVLPIRYWHGHTSVR